MQAVILVAGMGNRLSSVSEGKPKAMLRIGDKTIIQNQIEQCLELGVEEYIFVIGYEKDRLQEHILRYLPDKEIIFVENSRYQETNTLYSLYLAREYITGAFLYFNGDVFFRKQFLELLQPEREKTQLLMKEGKCESEEVKLQLDAQGRVIAIGKELEASVCAGEFIGIAYFAEDDVEKFVKCLEEGYALGEEGNFFEYALNLLCQRSELLAIKTGDIDCIEIDFPEDLVKARELFT